MPSLSARWAILTLLAIFLLTTCLAIGIVPLRLANAVAEDSPVLFAHYLADPAHWRGDVWMTNALIYTLGTPCNWIPALLFKFAGVAPEISTILLTYLQGALFAVAIWIYARRFTDRNEAAFTAALFTLAAEPYQWNLSVNGYSIGFVYGAHMAMPFLLFTAAALLSGREWLALGLLMASGFVHAGLTLSMSLFVGLFLLVTQHGRSHRDFLAKGLTLVGVTTLYLLLTQILAAHSGQTANHHQMFEIFRMNGHLFPWLHDWSWSRELHYRLPTVLGFASLFAWIFALAPPRDPRLVSLLRAVMLLAPLLLALYGFGVLSEIPAFIQAVFPRFIGILCLFVSPFLVVFLVDRIEGNDRAAVASAALILLLLGGQGFGFFVGPVIALLSSLSGRRRAWAWLLAWVILLVCSPLISHLGGSPELAQTLREWLAPGVLLSPPFLGLALFTAGTLLFLPPRLRFWPVAAVMTFFCLYRGLAFGDSTRTPEARGNYEAQIWAKAHTPENAVFIVVPNELSWRVLSNRRALNSDPGPGVAYSGNLEVLAYRNRLQSFFREHRAEDLSSLRSEEDLISFARAFGGDYVLASVSMALRLPRVYANDRFAIYRLPQSTALPEVPKIKAQPHDDQHRGA